MTGGVLSSTVMVWLAVLLLPQASRAVQVRVFEYSCGHDPGVVTSLGVRVGFGSQASLAVGLLNTGVAGHSMVEGPPTPEITGGVLSSTVMVCEALLLLPQASRATQVRVFEYSWGHVPGVVTSLGVSVGFGSHTSLAVGVLNTGVFGHSIVEGPPTPEITGAAVSSTVMVWAQIELFPQSSTAFQVRVTEYFCAHGPGVVTSADVIVRLLSHASVNCGVPKLGVAGHWMVELPGHDTTVGAVVSVTLTVFSQ